MLIEPELAEKLGACMEARERNDGSEYWVVVDPETDAGTRAKELIHKGHGEHMPSDWIYAACHEIFELFGTHEFTTGPPEDDCDELGRYMSESICFGHLMAWVMEDPEAVEYVDSALADFPHDHFSGLLMYAYANRCRDLAWSLLAA